MAIPHPILSSFLPICATQVCLIAKYGQRNLMNETVQHYSNKSKEREGNITKALGEMALAGLGEEIHDGATLRNLFL